MSSFYRYRAKDFIFVSIRSPRSSLFSNKISIVAQRALRDDCSIDPGVLNRFARIIDDTVSKCVNWRIYCDIWRIKVL